ncbi:MAG: phosphoheptose isomerase [Ignavibacteria bacterium GWA2_55_11]|nr:MAG: phosphoheptose isomerase [Ignavibacteria bacterium GWA2_55_11]OGU45588.1 MAG: phosphoheptose isomerase [Ignavibacteria bacterium GWC2_56_12]OGU70471.1 MAG: phosphoheptose isomerase [Ignavibacteria bacterium RIFCSPLOWO2_12_FULL_56_21]OGU73922.1 MAG: phosphoheptose isomerase [Ignavibacteria bacterium RIFCSPLOWO2_02_FULL_55_14]HAV22460.1 phosphoheptose isomerase [Bacteroidota bacterium]
MTLLYREKFIKDSLRESADVKLKIAEQLPNAISKAIDLLLKALTAKKKVLLCGNGGSAADAQHLATEFVIRLNPKIQRPGIPAIALTTDTSNLTAGANDLGYDNVFARSVEALGNEGDVLIGISTSGNSESVNRAFKKAREKKMITIAFLGKDGGMAKELVDHSIIVPSADTQRIQEGHITIGHIIFQEVEQEMYG